MAGLGHQRLGLLGVAGDRGQGRILGVHRPDVMVLGDAAEALVAEVEHGGVVDGELHRVPELLVVERRLRHVHAHAEGVGGDRLRLGEAEAVVDLDVGGGGLVARVDLLRLEGRHLGRGVVAVVDELDAVEEDRADVVDRVAPPGAVGALLVDGLHADLGGDELPRAGADGRGGQVAAGRVEAAVHDERRVVGEVRDDGDVGVGEVQLDGEVVDLLDRAVAGAEDLARLLLLDDGAVFLGDVAGELLLALLLEEGVHARRHGVVRHMRLAPAGQVEDDVVGVEGVAVRPGHALAEMKGVFRRVVIDFPALDQPGLEGEVGGVAYQRLAEEPGLVAFLRPVEDARIVHAHDRLGDLDDAAGVPSVPWARARVGMVEADQAVGGRAGDAEGGRHRQELAPGKLAFAGLAGEVGHARVHRLAVDRLVRHRFLPAVALPGPCSIVRGKSASGQPLISRGSAPVPELPVRSGRSAGIASASCVR